MPRTRRCFHFLCLLCGQKYIGLSIVIILLSCILDFCSITQLSKTQQDSTPLP